MRSRVLLGGVALVFSSFLFLWGRVATVEGPRFAPPMRVADSMEEKLEASRPIIEPKDDAVAARPVRKVTKPLESLQNVVLVAVVDKLDAIDMFVLPSWIATGARVFVFVNEIGVQAQNRIRSELKVIKMKSFPVSVKDVYEQLPRDAEWFVHVQRGLVLPQDFITKVLSADEIESSRYDILLGASYECFAPRDLAKLKQYNADYSVLSIHRRFRCSALPQVLGFSYAFMRSRKLSLESANAFTVGASADFAWLLAVVVANPGSKLLVTTPSMPVARLVHRADKVTFSSKVMTEYTKNLKALCPTGEFDWIAPQAETRSDQLLRFMRNSTIMRAAIKCSNADLEKISIACPEKPNGSSETLMNTVLPNGDYIISSLDLKGGDAEVFDEMHQQLTCLNRSNLVLKYQGDRHFAKPTDLHVCLANCWMGGTGSRTLGMALVYNLSMELGFKLFFHEVGNDYEHGVFRRMIDKVRPLYEARANEAFRPRRCDYLFRGWDNACVYRANYRMRSYMHYELYNHVMFNFLQDNYSPRLRAIVNDAVADLLKTRSSQQIIPVYVRLEDQMGGRKDARTYRAVTLADVEFLMDYISGQIRSPLFLVSGDKGAYMLANRTDVLMAEDFMANRLGRSGSRLEAQFSAMDLSSRFKKRVGLVYSNNFYMQMGFHRLNNNVEGIEYADTFSMRVYDYENRILRDFEDSRFNRAYWASVLESPYDRPVNQSTFHEIRACFNESLFGWNSTVIEDRANLPLSLCERSMLSEIAR